MNPEDLIAKANQALISAKILLESGDANGACNRAYYAMFDAARAALLVSGAEVGKTHKGILNTFSHKIIKVGKATVEMGRHLKHAEAYRYLADYESSFVQIDDARNLVNEAEVFIATIQRDFLGETKL